LEAASIFRAAALRRYRLKGGRASDLFVQKFPDVYGAFFATKETARNTFAFDVLALIFCGIAV
jgi:hypothetical protein